MTESQTELATTKACSFPLSLFPRGAVFTVLGDIHDWRLGWAGRISATLRLSVGDLPFAANRDNLPLDIGQGSRVRIKMRRRHRDDESPIQVLSAVAMAAQEPGETSWIPTSLFHRNAAMAQMRRLLSTMEPGLQSIFMSAMVDAQVQRRFFWRPAAADHHCHPGGLLDQSVAAARLAHEGTYANERERGMATLACLLFDLGKVFEERLEPDEARLWPELQPHAQTSRRLQAPLLRVAHQHPELADEFACLLGCDDLGRPVSDFPHLAPLRKRVCDAAQQAWALAQQRLPMTQSQPGMGRPTLSWAHSDPSQASAPTEPAFTEPGAQPAPSNGPPTFSIEWAAGFVDGEGCISIVRQTYKGGRRKPTYCVAFSITQNDRAVLEHLQAGLGKGRIYKVARKLQHKRQVYTLNFTGISALRAIAVLRPHFVRKGPEADAVWAYWCEARGGERPGGKGWPPEVQALREHFYRKLRKLK